MLTTRAKAPKAVDPNKAIRIKRAHDYPIQIWILLTCFLGILTFCHLGILLVYSWRKRRARARRPQYPQDEYEHRKSPAGDLKRSISLRRFPLAALNSFRIVAFRITLPIGGGSVLNGAEIGIITGYIVALFTWEFVNCMNVTTGVKLDAAYWANRAACIVRSQFPLFVVLAGKNNIISLLTGVSYEKLNVLHRAAARICLVLIWVHFWGRVKQGLTKDLVLSNPWVRTGVMTATAYTLLVIISFRPLRTRFYEFFFFSHFLLVLIIMIGAYFHMRRGFGQHTFVEVGPYLIPAFSFWALDRFLRLVLVLRNNRTSTFSSKSGVHGDAMIELLSPTMIRVTLTRKMTWRAGQSAFLIMPDVSNIPFEAHPFTIATIPKRGDFPTSSSGESSNSSRESGGKELQENKLLFLIRAKRGFTRRLQEAAGCQGNSGRKFPLSVYIDGPYGSPPDLNAFQSVILIAGGSGVTYTLPMLQQIVYEANYGSTVCRNIFFIWVVPHRSNISWIANAVWEALAASPHSLRIRIQVYVTQEVSTNTKEVADGESKPLEATMYKLLDDNRMKVNVGRPNVQTLLEDELRCAEGHVSVDVAGPTGLASDVREALRSGAAGPLAVLKGGPDVTLHVETYGIAASIVAFNNRGSKLTV